MANKRQKTRLSVYDGQMWVVVNICGTKREAVEEAKWYKRKGMETHMENIGDSVTI